MVHGEARQLSRQLKHMEMGGRLVAHKGLDVQVHRDVLGRDDGDGGGARGYLGVNHMALALGLKVQLNVETLKGGKHLKDPLCKD